MELTQMQLKKSSVGQPTKWMAEEEGAK